MRTVLGSRFFTGVALSAALMLSACGPPQGLRVESYSEPQSDSAPTTPSQVTAPPIFAVSDVRLAVLEDDSLSNTSGYSQLYEILAYCQDCITLTETLTTDGKTFQLATVSPPSVSGNFAGLAVEDVDGEPRVKLLVTGHDLSFRAGQNGTIVAQENILREGDPECCPSGWSVQVFRYRAGNFVAGQRIGEL